MDITINKERNIAHLLRNREVGLGTPRCLGAPARDCSFASWLERDFIQHCSAEYVDLRPTPRSTIAAAFSPDGTVVASTHGDHTVKVSDCVTGRSVQVMNGHMRTPWVVRFNPANTNMLASGSLDHLVNIWQLNTGHRLQHHDFGRPIASIAFHPSGELMAIASGHKVYVWRYGAPDKSPAIVLKTRKSLRAIHFHPHGMPLLLTAEVVERKPTPSALDPAANPPAASQAPVAQGAQAAPAHGANTAMVAQQDQAAEDEISAALAAQQQAALHQLSGLVYAANHAHDERQRHALLGSLLAERDFLQAINSQAGHAPEQPSQPVSVSEPAPAPRSSNWWWDWWLPGLQRRRQGSGVAESSMPSNMQAHHHQQQSAPSPSRAAQTTDTSPIIPLVPQDFESAFDPAWGWEVSDAAAATAAQQVHDRRAVMLVQQLPPATSVEQPCVVSLNLWPFNPVKYKTPLANSRLCLPRTVLCSEMGAHFSRCGRYLAVAVQADTPSEACEAWLQRQAAAAAASAPAPSTHQQCPPSPHMPDAPHRHMAPPSPAPSHGTTADDLQFQMELESGMVGGVPTPTPGAHTRTFMRQAISAAFGHSTGASSGATTSSLHMSRWGVPAAQAAAGTGAGRPNQAASGSSSSGIGAAASASTASARGPLFELRVYSLEGPTFGQILHARPIRAAHCLTSIQFSPTSDHLLVAYGRRHLTLCSLLLDGGYLTPVHTVLEVYRVSDMQVVRMLPTLEDEVNVATWHPAPGGGGHSSPGIVYGTKEGKLRLLRYDKRTPSRLNIPLVAAPIPPQADEELWEAEARTRQRSEDSD